jgi:hypothetical protein
VRPSIKESKNLSSRLLASGLFMCHNSVGGRKDNVPELPGWQQVDDPFLNFSILHIETRTNDTALVEAASQLNDNLVRTVVIDNFEFPNISWCVAKRGIKTRQSSESRLSNGTEIFLWQIIRRNASWVISVS